MDWSTRGGLARRSRPPGGITRIGAPANNLFATSNEMRLFTLAAVKDELPFGTYDVGLCGMSSDAADWSLPGGSGQTTVQVLKTD